jgi:serine/threonine protein kinase
MAGEILGGRYELMEPIGRGGMATIYRAMDKRMNRVVAVKVLREVYSTDRKFVTRFQMEARAASSLAHPNIVQVYDYGQSNDSYFIVMELIQGTDLRRFLRTHHVLEVEQAVTIAHDVALGLGAAHRRSIVHRDVKPQNIMLSSDGVIKLTDFGIASMYKDISAERLTTTGMTLGTVQYYAPEQAQGEIVKPAADVYALGIVLYEMLTGKPPFDGDTPVSVAVRHIQDLPDPPSNKNPRIPRGLETLILRCLEKDPRDRYSDGETLAKALDHYEEEGSGASTGPYEYGPKNVVQAGHGSGALPRPSAKEAPPPIGLRGSGTLQGRSGGLGSGVSGGLGSSAQLGRSGGLGSGPPRSGLGVGLPGPGRSMSRPLPPRLDIDEEEEPIQLSGSAASTRPVGAAPGTLPRSPVTSRPLHRRNTRLTMITTSLIVVATILLLGLSCFLASQLGFGAGLVAAIFGQSTPTVANAVVPYVIKQQEDSGIAKLRDAGFKITVKHAHASDPPGIIIGQQPDAGTTVPRGSSVTITVSDGPGTIVMPNLIGMTLDQAKQALAQSGITNTVTVVSKPSIQPNNTVIDQDPPVGREIGPTDPITLTVSMQVTPTPTVTATPTPTPTPTNTPTPTATP